MAAEVVQGNWTIADYALIVSLFSASISLISLGWNVWSKFHHPKGKLQVWFSFDKTIVGDKLSSVSLEAVNLGPTDLVLTEPMLPTRRPSILRGGLGWWSLKSTVSEVSGGKALIEGQKWPVKLAPGDTISVKMTASSFREGVNRGALGMGFLDSFQRFHEIPMSGYKMLEEMSKSNQ